MIERVRIPGLILGVLLLTACGEPEPEWHGREISGLMPPLEFELTSEEGETITEDAFRGEVVALFFGYTHCPDYCPATLSRLGQAVQVLPEDQREEVEVVFVSVDPKRDTPEHLKDYTDYFGEQVTGVTGEIPELRKLAKRYRTTFSYGEPNEKGHYLVSHGQAIYLFDRSGEIRVMVTDDLPPEKLAADLETLLAQ
jgi:protein SCO1/2